MSQVIVELGDGIQLQKAEINTLLEQDVNAQAMPKPMFDRLAATIERDQRLEQLPFCALTEKGIEIVSGHHRVRAARVAGMTEVYVLVDTTGLTRDQIAAKQLAHNSIHGESNADLVAKIFKSIGDVNARLESFIDPAKLGMKVEPISIPNIDLGLKYRAAMIMFLPYEAETFSKAVELATKMLTPDIQDVYMSELKLLEQFKAIMDRTSKAYGVRALGTILARMMEIVLAHLGEPPPPTGDWVPIVDVFKATHLPPETANTIGQALNLMATQKVIGEKDRWRAVELWAINELAK